MGNAGGKPLPSYERGISPEGFEGNSLHKGEARPKSFEPGTTSVLLG